MENALYDLTSFPSIYPALFLSDGAPFNFPGFSMMCIGFASVSILILEITRKTGVSHTEVTAKGLIIFNDLMIV